jgi:hypothetical protein
MPITGILCGELSYSQASKNIHRGGDRKIDNNLMRRL